MTTPSRDVHLSWIVVTHDSRRDLQALLPSVERTRGALAERGLSSEVIVIDNASADDSLAVARELLPSARTLGLPHNVGYGAAVNRGAELARGEWLLVSNADLFVGRDGLAALPEVLARQPGDVALVGPGLLGSDGRLALSAGRFPSMATLLTGLLRPCARRKYLGEQQHRQGTVDWVTGACFLARADAFGAVGGFDPGFFLYYEDVDLARRLQAGGHRTVHEPELQVVHVRPHHGRPPEPDIEEVVRASRQRYFDRHRPGWEAALLRRLVRLEVLVRERSARAAPAGPAAGAQPTVERPASDRPASTGAAATAGSSRRSTTARAASDLRSTP